MVLSIVILHFNTPDLIKKCIESIFEFEKENLVKKNINIIIGDNNSEPENFEKVKSIVSKFENVSLVKNSSNYGFGKGCNMIAKDLHSDYLLFLNSDANLKKTGLLSMINYLEENKKVGVLGGKMINPDGSVQKSAGKFYNIFNFILMIFGGEKFGLLRSSPSKISRVDWVSGGFMVISKNIFEKVGGFDENLFMYMEDMELCYRLRKQKIDTYFFPEVVVEHATHGSSNRGFAVINIYKGIIYFYKKHKGIVQYLVVLIFLKLKALAVYLLGVLSNNSYYKKTYLEALKI